MTRDSLEDRELTVFKSKRLTQDLYHYTGSDVGMFNILAEGRLRLSPFEATNDLWESRPFMFGLTVPREALDDEERASSVRDGIDRSIRLHSKVACLTQDWSLPEAAGDPNELRGWAHLSLWAHYGGGHTGMCLRFDKVRLVEALDRVGQAHRGSLHGPVSYRGTTSGTILAGVHTGWVEQYGVDAVAHEFALLHRESVFFSKNRDWSNEAEYRMVLMSETVLPEYLDIKKALTRVFVGDAFPKTKLPALRAVLQQYPGVAVERVKYSKRRLTSAPLEMSDESVLLHPRVGAPHESFAARLKSLRDSNVLRNTRAGRALGPADQGAADSSSSTSVGE